MGATGKDVLDRLAGGAARRDVADDGGEIGVLCLGQDLRRVQVSARPSSG
jgi:hypothetical protein